MPLFYFHLRTPVGLEPDEIGLELPGVEAAYLEAYRSIPGMAAEFARRGADPDTYGFTLTDAIGRVLMDVPFPEGLSRTWG